jgi:DNA polymerase elongation subunit (family B)
MEGSLQPLLCQAEHGKMKIRGVMARKGDTPEYVNKMQREVFQVLAEAKTLEELPKIEPKAREGCWKRLGKKQHLYLHALPIKNLEGGD